MVGKGRADYSLRRRGGEPVLLLEAKKLSDTSAPYDQIASYVVGENLRRSVKIPYCAITNGSRWQVFDVFTQQCVLDASVELDEPRRCALKLLGLWQPTLRDLAVLEPVGTWHGESVGTIAERGSQSRLRDSAHSAAGPSRPLSAGASVDWTPPRQRHTEPEQIRSSNRDTVSRREQLEDGVVGKHACGDSQVAFRRGVAHSQANAAHCRRITVLCELRRTSSRRDEVRATLASGANRHPD